jgi:hypothetical protein
MRTIRKRVGKGRRAEDERFRAKRATARGLSILLDAAVEAESAGRHLPPIEPGDWKGDPLDLYPLTPLGPDGDAMREGLRREISALVEGYGQSLAYVLRAAHRKGEAFYNQPPAS